MDIEAALQNLCGFGPTEFIEKAIDGGFIYQGKKPVYDDMQQAPCVAKFNYDGVWFGITKEQILLDPKSWEAVCRVEGWEKEWKDQNIASMLGKPWMYNMHAFIDHLIDNTE